MTRLPVPGSDDDVWGVILNAFLSVSLDSVGQIRDGVVAESMLDTGVRSKLDVATDNESALGDLDGRLTILENRTMTSVVIDPVSTAGLADGTLIAYTS